MSQSNPQDYINQFNESTQKMFEPWTKLNQAFLKNAEVMTEFSLTTMKSYSEIGLENMRQVAEIDSPESAKNFNDKQAEMLNTISQQMLSDAQRMTELGSSMHDEVMQVMNDVYGQTNEQMQTNMQKAADQATKAGEEYAANMSQMAEKFTEQASKATANASAPTPATSTSANADTAKTDSTKTGTVNTKTGTTGVNNTGKSASK